MCIDHYYFFGLSSSSICKYASAKSILENLKPWLSFWKSSSGNGKGCVSDLSTGFTVTLKSPQIQTFPVGFRTTTIGVAQSEWLTLSITPSFSKRSSSAPTTGLMANGSFLGLQYFGCISSLRTNLALVVVQQPRPGWQISVHSDDLFKFFFSVTHLSKLFRSDHNVELFFGHLCPLC